MMCLWLLTLKMFFLGLSVKATKYATRVDSSEQLAVNQSGLTLKLRYFLAWFLGSPVLSSQSCPVRLHLNGRVSKECAASLFFLLRNS